jgi:acyl dehydratase
MSDKHIHTLADVQLGDTLGPVPLFVPKDQVRTYANNVGMANVPRFTDDEGARKEGLPGMILPGNMSAALIGKLVGDWAQESRAKLVRLGTTYRSPVLPERNLSLHGFVTQVDHGQHIAELDIWIENEDGDRLVTATATVQFPS